MYKSLKNMGKVTACAGALFLAVSAAAPKPAQAISFLPTVYQIIDFGIDQADRAIDRSGQKRMLTDWARQCITRKGLRRGVGCGRRISRCKSSPNQAIRVVGVVQDRRSRDGTRNYRIWFRQNNTCYDRYGSCDASPNTGHCSAKLYWKKGSEFMIRMKYSPDGRKQLYTLKFGSGKLWGTRNSDCTRIANRKKRDRRDAIRSVRISGNGRAVDTCWVTLEVRR